MSLRRGLARSARARCAFAYSSFAALMALSWLTALGQGSGVDLTGTGGRHAIQGRLFFPSGQRADVRLKVRLESSIGGDLSILTDANGSFAFRSLRTGTYAVIIDGGDEFESFRETVHIESDGSSSRRGVTLPPAARPYTLQIHLQPKRQYDALAKPGVLHASLSAVPKPAQELYFKALEAARKGESDKAIRQLKEALALHPDFALALSELGVQYLKLKRIDEAVESLRAALKLLPDDYATLLTCGIALYERKELSEAEDRLRRALKRNSASPSAHFYLGLVLLRTGKLDESETELQQAVATGGEQMSLAHYYLGGLYWAKRDYRRAADELETYLRLNPKAPDAERIRATIRELRNKT